MMFCYAFLGVNYVMMEDEYNMLGCNKDNFELVEILTLLESLQIE